MKRTFHSSIPQFILWACLLAPTTMTASQPTQKLSGNIVDVVQGEVFPGTVEIKEGRITRITRDAGPYDCLLMPGLVDAHVHVESSLLSPAEFARMALVQGTVSAVADPHEIANVLGVAGVQAMIDSGKTVPFKFCFGAPSCVPATGFETAGATIDVKGVESLLRQPDIRFLSEMMNFPGVIHGDPAVIAKLELARRHGKPIDGHAPGLSGQALEKYVGAGIQTDHECFTLSEAKEKIRLGMKIIIREGSAARNFEALHPLLREHGEHCMLGTDDCHPNDLAVGHINRLVQRAVAAGHDRITALRCATLYPARHYGLKIGLLQAGDPADLIVVDNWRDFRVKATYVDGVKVAEAGRSLLPSHPMAELNQFRTKAKRPEDFRLPAKPGRAKAIEVMDGQLITKTEWVRPKTEAGLVVADTESDILKLVVVNRYKDGPPAVALVKNFGLRRGALASSVAHDSHNIVAVGASDADLAAAINAVIAHQGGLSVSENGKAEVLPLPIAGLMSNADGWRVAEHYTALDRKSKELGSKLRSPFMTLSFMALLVIPELKLSDQGLFDGTKFAPTTVFE